jgi:glutaredoxin 2
MLNLYIKTGCPFCIRVTEANETIKAPLILRNITEDSVARAELMEKGGKTQAPYLEDTDRGVSMYESLDIINYLSAHYGNSDKQEVAHVGNVCPID